MPALQTLLLFQVAALALNLTPGPDMLYVAARSSSEGRAAGYASALGIAVGCLVHVAALALGLSALLAAVPAAYDAVRFCGAAYLIVLGVRAILRPAALGGEAGLAPASVGTVFRQGVLTNVLNPKVALFFVAFVPQFLDPAAGPAWLQIVVLGLLFNLSGTLVNLGVALAASRATGWLRRNPGTAAAARRVSGAVFVGLGVRLALASRK
jgi:threonine/homoserine/homoserine lactone efflux protein